MPVAKTGPLSDALRQSLLRVLPRAQRKKEAQKDLPGRELWATFPSELREEPPLLGSTEALAKGAGEWLTARPSGETSLLDALVGLANLGLVLATGPSRVFGPEDIPYRRAPQILRQNPLFRGWTARKAQESLPPPPTVPRRWAEEGFPSTRYPVHLRGTPTPPSDPNIVPPSALRAERARFAQEHPTSVKPPKGPVQVPPESSGRPGKAPTPTIRDLYQALEQLGVPDAQKTAMWLRNYARRGARGAVVGPGRLRSSGDLEDSALVALRNWVVDPERTGSARSVINDAIQSELRGAMAGVTPPKAVQQLRQAIELLETRLYARFGLRPSSEALAHLLSRRGAGPWGSRVTPEQVNYLRGTGGLNPVDTALRDAMFADVVQPLQLQRLEAQGLSRAELHDLEFSTADAVEQLLQQLPGRQRQVAQKVFLEGKSQVDAAKELGIRQGTVSKDLAKLKEKLSAVAQPGKSTPEDVLRWLKGPRPPISGGSAPLTRGEKFQDLMSDVDRRMGMLLRGRAPVREADPELARQIRGAAPKSLGPTLSPEPDDAILYLAAQERTVPSEAQTGLIPGMPFLHSTLIPAEYPQNVRLFTTALGQVPMLDRLYGSPILSIKP